MEHVKVVKAASLWDGSIIDLNKIVRVGNPTLFRAGFGYMAEAKLSVKIDIQGSTPIIISEQTDNEHSTRDMNALPNYNSSILPSRDIYWKCADGQWKINPPDEEIACYAKFKSKVDELIDLWTNGEGE